MPQSIALIVFPLLMVYSAFSDLFTMRIANWLVGLLAVSFVVLAVMAGMDWRDIGMHAAAGAVLLVLAFAFFAFRWIGGGDAKLVAATGLWLGFGLLLPYLIYAALLGGALTLAILGLRRFPLWPPLAKVKWIDRLHDAKSGVPYGIALAIAGLLVYPGTEIFVRFIG